MHLQTVSKTLGACAIAVLSVTLLTVGSVAQGGADSSRNVRSSDVSGASYAAPGQHTGVRPVRSSMRRMWTAAAPYLAKATPPPSPAPEPVLLAAVDQQDIKPHHRTLANAVLRALPSNCRRHLRNFYVKYADITQRGLGGKTTIIIDGTAPDTEFAGLLVHECGHVTHGNLHGTPASGESTFRDGRNAIYNDAPVSSFFAISWMTESVLRRDADKKTDFVSGYAQSDAFEDFAETFAMYILHRPALRERADTSPAIAAKLAWMETYLPTAENPLGESLYTWNRQVPWDVTRLPYALRDEL